MSAPVSVVPIKIASGKPSTPVFLIQLVTLWGLNLADTFQTMYLSASGMLSQEANLFINFFLLKGPAILLIVKVLALILISSMLIRGWYDFRGIKVLSAQYSRDQVRAAIQFMLTVGIIYYVIIVAFPFIALFVSGSFNP
jgi:hypothetical protein